VRLAFIPRTSTGSGGNRRLRSDLRTFRALLDESWAERLRDDLRWLGGELGGFRDAEVCVTVCRRRGRDAAPGRPAPGWQSSRPWARRLDRRGGTSSRHEQRALHRRDRITLVGRPHAGAHQLSHRPRARCSPAWSQSRGDRSGRGALAARGDVPTSSSTTCASGPSAVATAAEARPRDRKECRESSRGRVAALQEVLGSCTTRWWPRRGCVIDRCATSSRTALFAGWELVAQQRDAALEPERVAGRVEARRRGGRVPGDEATSYLVRHAKAGSRALDASGPRADH